MNIEELKSYLSNECDNLLSIARNTNMSEDNFKNYLDQPIKIFNDKFSGSKTTTDFQDNIKMK